MAGTRGGSDFAGPVRRIREALEIFLPENEGVIIDITSVNGEHPFCGVAYTATQGASNTSIENAAMRLIRTNIRCNAVAPGSTVPPMRRANKNQEHPGGKGMWEYSRHYVDLPGPECDRWIGCSLPLCGREDGKTVKEQVLQFCNRAFLQLPRMGFCDTNVYSLR